MKNDLVVQPESTANPEAENLYEILGVAKDASDAEIRKAFRRAARKFHPDKAGGDEKEARARFQKIKRAYETLSNRTQREFYDNTGSAKPDTHEMEVKARDFVMQTFRQTIQNVTSGQMSFNLAQIDMVRLVIDFITNAQQTMHNNRADVQSKISKIEVVQKRMRHKKNDFNQTPVGGMIAAQIMELRRNYSMIGLELETLAVAMKIAREYEYEVDPQPSFTVSRSNGGHFYTTT